MITGKTNLARAERNPSAAFTLTDLVTMLAVLALLAMLLLPAAARTQADSRAFQCLNNNRELNRAWRMWADDNQDRIPYASGDTVSYSPLTWVSGGLDFNPANRSNWDPTVDIMRSPLWPYCGTNLSIWKCPSDSSYVVVNGVPKPRVRSFCMNLYLGAFSGSSGGLFTGYRIYLKLTDITTPPPASLFVFLDERADAINWGSFYVDMAGYSPRNTALYKIADFPSDYHDGAAALSYADGRGELHRWVDLRTTPPHGNGLIFDGSTETASPRNSDIAWLQDRATRPK